MSSAQVLRVLCVWRMSTGMGAVCVAHGRSCGRCVCVVCVSLMNAGDWWAGWAGGGWAGGWWRGWWLGGWRGDWRRWPGHRAARHRSRPEIQPDPPTPAAGSPTYIPLICNHEMTCGTVSMLIMLISLFLNELVCVEQLVDN